MEQVTTTEELGPGGVPKGAQTHQYYRVENIPPRFDNPEVLPRPEEIINNPGNPIFTCGYPKDAQTLIPEPAAQSCSNCSSTYHPAQLSEWLQGYGGKKQHPMYITTSSSYGSKPPCVHTVPTQFHARSQQFSQHLGQCGMYRNFSLNTEMDKSKV